MSTHPTISAFLRDFVQLTDNLSQSTKTLRKAPLASHRSSAEIFRNVNLAKEDVLRLSNLCETRTTLAQLCEASRALMKCIDATVPSIINRARENGAFIPNSLSSQYITDEVLASKTEQERNTPDNIDEEESVDNITQTELSHQNTVFNTPINPRKSVHIRTPDSLFPPTPPNFVPKTPITPSTNRKTPRNAKDHTLPPTPTFGDVGIAANTVDVLREQRAKREKDKRIQKYLEEEYYAREQRILREKREREEFESQIDTNKESKRIRMSPMETPGGKTLSAQTLQQMFVQSPKGIPEKTIIQSPTSIKASSKEKLLSFETISLTSEDEFTQKKVPSFLVSQVNCQQLNICIEHLNDFLVSENTDCFSEDEFAQIIRRAGFAKRTKIILCLLTTIRRITKRKRNDSDRVWSLNKLS